MTRIILTTACVLSMACSSSTMGRTSAPEQAMTCAGGVVGSDTELERYAACTEISGHLELRGISSLAPLASLRRVEGMLSIEHTRKLYTLSGLERLRSVGSLEIRDNAALIYGGALRNLENVGHVSVSDNPRLSAQYGFLVGLGRATTEVTFSGNWGLAAEGVTQSPDRQVVAVR